MEARSRQPVCMAPHPLSKENCHQRETKRFVPRCSSKRQLPRLPAAQRERDVPSATRRAGAKSGQGFHNRQARTDAAIRTIPDLRNFGN
jgi:hypothetical protein